MKDKNDVLLGIREPLIGKLLGTYLRRAGYKCKTTASKEEFLAYLGNGLNGELIIMDPNDVDSNGNPLRENISILETALDLMKSKGITHPERRIHAISGYEEPLVMARKEGVVGTQKPFNPQDMVKWIREQKEL